MKKLLSEFGNIKCRQQAISVIPRSNAIHIYIAQWIIIVTKHQLANLLGVGFINFFKKPVEYWP